MSESIQLSLEQELNQRIFADQVKKLSREQAQEYLVYLYEQMIIRENMYQEFLKHEWSIGSDPFYR